MHRQAQIKAVWWIIFPRSKCITPHRYWIYVVFLALPLLYTRSCYILGLAIPVISRRREEGITATSSSSFIWADVNTFSLPKMSDYIQFFYRMLFSGLMHKNPMRFMCTHPWLQLALWGRYLCDLSWWVCSTQKHWVCGSPCNSYPVCTAADAALDIKLTFCWISLFLFVLLFILHGILHQSASVVHLKFFIPMSPSSLGLNLYVVLFFTLFFLPFSLPFFFLFLPSQPNRK